MFTLKLYRGCLEKFVECESIDVWWYDSNQTSAQISTHAKDGTDTAFYIGDSTKADFKIDDIAWYERAILENANGKTTQVFQPTYPRGNDTPPFLSGLAEVRKNASY